MAKWFAEEVSPNTKNRNPGWDEYFTSNTNTVESLVRESIQNSLDAWLDKDKEDSDSSRRPAEVRIYYSGGAAALSEANYQEYFSEALPHYLAPECETAKPEGPCPFIVIEDYNTTGLTGSLSAKDNQPYFKFFLRARICQTNRQKISANGGLGRSFSQFPAEFVRFSCSPFVRTLQQIIRVF